jgi:hypothetical protein
MFDNIQYTNYNLNMTHVHDIKFFETGYMICTYTFP